MVVHHLVVEHGEVQGKSEPDGVARVELLGESIGLSVTLKGSGLDLLENSGTGRLSNISVVVTDHLLEEGLGLVVDGELEALVLHDVHDLDALVVELLFDLGLVAAEGVSKLLVFGVLLDGSDGSNGTSLGSDEVFKSDRKEVPLVDGEVLSVLGLNGVLEELDHVLKPLGLFRNSRQKDLLLHLQLLNF